jgi:hypothetical protein
MQYKYTSMYEKIPSVYTTHSILFVNITYTSSHFNEFVDFYTLILGRLGYNGTSH